MTPAILVGLPRTRNVATPTPFFLVARVQRKISDASATSVPSRNIAMVEPMFSARIARAGVWKIVTPLLDDEKKA
jgi:hypothetical protein